MIFCKNWKRWSVSCYTDRLLANQIAEKTGPYQLPDTYQLPDNDRQDDPFEVRERDGDTKHASSKKGSLLKSNSWLIKAS